MNITNEKEVMIFKNEYGKYTVGLTRKNGDKYENGYFPIQFKNGTELENQTKIKIKNAFLTFRNWEHEGKKGTTYYIMCTEFEKENATQVQNDPFAEMGERVDQDYLD